MNRYIFIVDEKLYNPGTQDDVLKLIKFIVDDAEITIIDTKECTSQSHYGHWLLEKILEWLKLSAALTTVKFNNMLEGILYETDTVEECSNL